MDFQESKTMTNLQNLYRRELETSGKYELFSIQADREVLIEIRNAFHNISGQERTVAEMLRRLILGGQTTTEQNLFEAEREDLALKELCQEYSMVAMEEGFTDIASRLNGVANIKINHNNVFSTLANDMVNDQLFCKSEPVVWICLGCGNIMTRACAPDVCPVCGYPQGYYQLLREC